MKKVVYAIDDEPDILEAISIILTDAGFKVETDTTFKTVNQILGKRPNLILLDLLLIGTNGREICAQIRNTRYGKHIPIILVSAHPEAKLEEYTKICGATGFLQKPFDIDVLVDTVKRYLV